MNYNINRDRADLEHQGKLLESYRQQLEEIRGVDKKEEARVEKILWEAEVLYEEKAYNLRFLEIIFQKKNELGRIIASNDDDESKCQSTNKIVNELNTILAEGERIDRNVRRLKRIRFWRIIKLVLFPYWRD